MSKAKRPAQEVGPFSVTVLPTKEVQSERIYSNFVYITHGPHDFTLLFCDAQTPWEELEQKKVASHKTIKAPVQVEIAIPVNLVKPLIKALQDNYDVYKESYGPKTK